MEIIVNGVRYKEISGQMQVLGLVPGICPTELNIPDIVDGKPVTSIFPSAFKGASFTQVWLPSTIAIICSQSFENCKKLKEVSIGGAGEFDDVLHIGENAFKDCTNLVNFDAWNCIVNLDSYAFANCKKLEFLDMSIKQLSSHVFHNCQSVVDIGLANNAVLDDDCLEGCVLQKICTIGDATIPKKILDYLFKTNTKVYCTRNSNLLELIYDGYPIELYSEEEEDILLSPL